MNNPLVSIIIPVYNTEKYVEEAIGSAICQTYQNLEIIIVDDGSTDKSIAIVEKTIANNSKAKLLFRNREPKGASTCRNIGIKSAKGDYVIFLDADDVLAPHCLEQRVQIFSKQSDLDFCVFLMKQFRNSPDDMDRIINTFSDIDDISSFLSMKHPWPLTSVIWRTESLIKLNGFKENFQRLQDPEIHLRALLKKFNYKKFYSYQADCYYRLDYTVKFDKLKNELINSYLNFIKFFYSLFIEKKMFKYSTSLKNETIPIILNTMADFTNDLHKVNIFLLELKSLGIITNGKHLKYKLLFVIRSNYRLTINMIKNNLRKYFPSLLYSYRRLSNKQICL